MKKDAVNNSIFIAMTLEEYFRELELMEKQYGCEEELYPFINMFLRNGKNSKKLSIRAVANMIHIDIMPGRKIISSKISFPDIAIFDEDFILSKLNNNEKKDEEKVNKSLESDFKNNYNKIYGCVEAKIIWDKTLDNINNNIYVNLNKTKIFIAKPTRKAKYYCVAKKYDEGCDLGKPLEYESITQDKLFTKGEKVDWELVSKKDYPKSKEFQRNISQSNFWAKVEERICIQIGSEKLELTEWEKHSDVYRETVTNVGQIFGELFWYGKVLYTNGLVWKFLKVTKCGEKYKGDEARLYLRKQIYDNCIKGDKKWYEIINDKKVKIKCTEIADLTKGYTTYKNNMELTSEHEEEWKKLIKGLAEIKWLPEQAKEE